MSNMTPSKGPLTRFVLRIRVLLVPKIGSCEHIENDLPKHGSVILKKRKIKKFSSENRIV